MSQRPIASGLLWGCLGVIVVGAAIVCGVILVGLGAMLMVGGL